VLAGIQEFKVLKSIANSPHLEVDNSQNSEGDTAATAATTKLKATLNPAGVVLWFRPVTAHFHFLATAFLAAPAAFLAAFSASFFSFAATLSASLLAASFAKAVSLLSCH
jgi:hypothetical protein